MDVATPPVGSYSEFLLVTNRALREANCEQRAALRALAAQHLRPEECTPLVEKIMGWA